MWSKYLVGVGIAACLELPIMEALKMGHLSGFMFGMGIGAICTIIVTRLL